MATTAKGIPLYDDSTTVAPLQALLNGHASALDTALDAYGNTLKGTAAAREGFKATATSGMLWQDTDGIKMIWRKDGSSWVPAVWTWGGSTTQMNGFTNAPNGFIWVTPAGARYVRLGGSWGPLTQSGSVTLPSIPANTLGSPIDVTFPEPFPVTPKIVTLNSTGFRIKPSWNFLTATSIRLYPANVWITVNPSGETLTWTVSL